MGKLSYGRLPGLIGPILAGMGNTFTAPIFRLMHWFDRRAMVCANCRAAVPQGRRDFCTDACEHDYMDAKAM